MTLTHHLEYDARFDNWSCDCGYVLGTGRAALYAQCPNQTAYGENSVSSATWAQTTYAKTKRQARKTRSGISEVALDLFEI